VTPTRPAYVGVRRSELMIGLVYGAGVAVDPVEELLRSELDDFGYQVETVHLSDFFPTVLGEDFSSDSANATRRLQDMGDELRRLGGLDAIARLAVFLVAARRQRLEGEPERVAWLIRSLRRPEEVRYLRRVRPAVRPTRYPRARKQAIGQSDGPATSSIRYDLRTIRCGCHR
jgi:hypothetical protein